MESRDLPVLRCAADPRGVRVRRATWRATRYRRTRMADQLSKAAARGDTASVLDAPGRRRRRRRARRGRSDAGHGRDPRQPRRDGPGADRGRVRTSTSSDDRLDNPFLYAGAEGLLDILRLTIEAGADPTLTNRFGGTALIPASERGHVEVVRELLTRTRGRHRPRQQPRLDRAARGDRPEQWRRTAPAGRPAAGRSRRGHHDPRQGRGHAARARPAAWLHADRADPRRGGVRRLRRRSGAASGYSGRRPMIVNTSVGSRSSNVKSAPHSRSTKPAVSKACAPGRASRRGSPAAGRSARFAAGRRCRTPRRCRRWPRCRPRDRTSARAVRLTRLPSSRVACFVHASS